MRRAGSPEASASVGLAVLRRAALARWVLLLLRGPQGLRGRRWTRPRRRPCAAAHWNRNLSPRRRRARPSCQPSLPIQCSHAETTAAAEHTRATGARERRRAEMGGAHCALTHPPPGPARSTRRRATPARPLRRTGTRSGRLNRHVGIQASRHPRPRNPSHRQRRRRTTIPASMRPAMSAGRVRRYRASRCQIIFPNMITLTHTV
mmetsp:Transcript_98855/g.308024  ORF Transcript_98855/g.308024 Transcript_98855/m.308024 type:complete len:205 (+) Transcript_98855:209-823(+)